MRNRGLEQKGTDPTKPSAEDKGADSEPWTVRDKNLQLISIGLITCISQDADTLKKKFPKELLNLWHFELEGPLEMKPLTL